MLYKAGNPLHASPTHPHQVGISQFAVKRVTRPIILRIGISLMWECYKLIAEVLPSKRGAVVCCDWIVFDQVMIFSCTAIKFVCAVAKG